MIPALDDSLRIEASFRPLTQLQQIGKFQLRRVFGKRVREMAARRTMD